MSGDEHDAVVRNSFQQQVALFTGDDSVFARRPDSPLAWIEPLGPEMVVLDVACGATHVAEQLAPHVRQVVGVDLTPELLRLGADRLRAQGITNVLLQEGNAAHLPFVDDSFDVVLCRSAVHHFSRPAVAIAEMARVCRPEGRVVVSDLIAPSAGEQAAFDAVHRQLDPSHAHAFVDTELVELIGTGVGTITYAESTPPFAISIAHIFTDAADREAVTAALRSDLDGGPPTGFRPVADGDDILVSFASAVVHATPR